MSDLKKIKDELLLKLKSKLNLSQVNQMKSDLFGKNGLISSQFKKIGTIETQSLKTERTGTPKNSLTPKESMELKPPKTLPW